MHPIARRCVWAAVVLWVAGAALVGFVPTLYDLAEGWLGGAVDIAVGFLQDALVPTGAALLGAAVVVQALRGTRPSAAEAVPEAEGAPSTGAMPTVGPPTGTVPTTPPAPPSRPVPAVPPLSGAVPAAPSSSGPVPTAGPVTGTVGPVSPGAGATPAAKAGRQPRSRRSRQT